MAYRGIRVEFSDDNIAIVTMCDGDNKFGMDYVQTWHGVIDKLEQNTEVKGLITTGKGRAFSVGLDLDWLRQSDHKTLDLYHDQLHRLYKRVMSLGIPTVAAINGHAIAEGAFLALVHDYRIMRSDRGWINWPEVRVKLPFTRTMLDIVRIKMMSSIAQREAILFGKRLDAKEAQTLGIIDACVPEELLISTALQTVKTAHGNNSVDSLFFKSMKNDVYNEYVSDEKLTSKF